MVIYSESAAQHLASNKPPWHRPLWPQENKQATKFYSLKF